MTRIPGCSTQQGSLCGIWATRNCGPEDPEVRAGLSARARVMPALDRCAQCGEPVDTTGGAAFGPASGGVLCPSCGPGQPHVVTLSSMTLEAIRVLASPGSAWREPALSSGRWRPAPPDVGAVISHVMGIVRGSGPYWECDPMDSGFPERRSTTASAETVQDSRIGRHGSSGRALRCRARGLRQG